MMKHSDDVQQEGEEKATDAFKEGHASTSAPTETATDHETPNDFSRLGVSEERPARGKFMFQVQLTPLDVKGRLLIPAEEAEDYFPPLPTTTKDYKEKIEISDPYEDWYVTLVYDVNEHAFMITKGWQEFVAWHNFETMDVIRFYIPVPCFHDKHFLVEHVKREQAEKAINNIHEFKQENFLFQLQLTSCDIIFGRLIIPKEEVRNHFPVIQIPLAVNKLERLKLTDAQNKDWYVKIMFSYDVEEYMIMKGWHGFAVVHNLQAMDVIKFYKPVLPSHKRHFLIDCEKRQEAVSNVTQSSSPKNDGNSREQSHGGCYKGKEAAVGHKKPPPRGRGCRVEVRMDCPRKRRQR